MFKQQWTLIDDKGATAVSFTSFLDLDVRNEGTALSYPIEDGGFANYNKTQSPLAISVTLGKQGDESDFEYTLGQLDNYKNQAVLLSVSTPAAFYQSMTLESYSYQRSSEGGSGMLVVNLNLVEVRQVQTQVRNTAISEPQNPTSFGRVNIGRTQAEKFASLKNVGKLV